MINNLARLYKIKEATEYIGRSRTKAYELIRDGQLNAVRIGGRVFIEETELVRFREANARPVRLGRGSISSSEVGTTR